MVVREWACVIRLDACVRLIRRNILYMFYLGTSQRPRPSNRPRAVSSLHRWPNGKPYILQSKIDLWKNLLAPLCVVASDFQHDQSVNRNSHATLIILSEIHQTCQCSGLSSSSKYEELHHFLASLKVGSRWSPILSTKKPSFSLFLHGHFQGTTTKPSRSPEMPRASTRLRSLMASLKGQLMGIVHHAMNGSIHFEWWFTLW